MEIVFRIVLFLSGIINLLPATLMFFPAKMSESYGIEIPNADFELLLRHRAVLFGIVGGLMIYSSLIKKHYSISVMVGLVSMISFVLLYFLINNINAELSKVMKVDLIAALILLAAFLIFKLKK